MCSRCEELLEEGAADPMSQLFYDALSDIQKEMQAEFKAETCVLKKREIYNRAMVLIDRPFLYTPAMSRDDGSVVVMVADA